MTDKFDCTVIEDDDFMTKDVSLLEKDDFYLSIGVRYAP